MFLFVQWLCEGVIFIMFCAMSSIGRIFGILSREDATTTRKKNTKSFFFILENYILMQVNSCSLTDTASGYKIWIFSEFYLFKKLFFSIFKKQKMKTIVIDLLFFAWLALIVPFSKSICIYRRIERKKNQSHTTCLSLFRTFCLYMFYLLLPICGVWLVFPSFSVLCRSCHAWWFLLFFFDEIPNKSPVTPKQSRSNTIIASNKKKNNK